jgi:ribose/xylose/arabinose/galactoside ABC-type transport system permease subunit
VGVVLGVLAFAGIQNALLLTNFNQEAASIPVGGLLLISVFVPNMAALTRRIRDVIARRGKAAPPAIGAGHD